MKSSKTITRALMASLTLLSGCVEVEPGDGTDTASSTPESNPPNSGLGRASAAFALDAGVTATHDKTVDRYEVNSVTVSYDRRGDNNAALEIGRVTVSIANGANLTDAGVFGDAEEQFPDIGGGQEAQFTWDDSVFRHQSIAINVVYWVGNNLAHERFLINQNDSPPRNFDMYKYVAGGRVRIKVDYNVIRMCSPTPGPGDETRSGDNEGCPADGGGGCSESAAMAVGAFGLVLAGGVRRRRREHEHVAD